MYKHPTKKIYFYIKRILDWILALIAVIILLIPILVIAVIIKLDSKGPVFFPQERVGFLGKSFKIIKFRTMVIHAEELEKYILDKNGYDFVQIENDFRVTRVGNFLRKYSIDEIAQVFNVLRGEMSFIGPRPFIQLEMEKLGEEAKKRMEVMPGITGLAQVNGRSMLNAGEKLKFDSLYVDNFSLWQDVMIILKTIPLIFSGKGAM